MYRLSGDRRYAHRAIAEMRAAAGFPGWFPQHLLDTAEMTAELAVGYDWCDDALSPDDRAAIRRAFVDMGLDPGIAATLPGRMFSKLNNNWVQVCYGGLTLGGLAVAEDEPDRARRLIAHSVPGMAAIMTKFAPDGGFEEGPVYWNYATAFDTYYLAALDTAIGTDSGLSDLPGYADTGAYRAQTIGPTGLVANGDCGTRVSQAPQMFWMARKFRRPQYAASERAIAAADDAKGRGASVLSLLWQFPPVTGRSTPVPPAQSFGRIGAAFLRTAWNDPGATYVAFKGGDGRASHGQLDLGQVIIDAGGRRWAVDLGTESYASPGYFGKQRYDYDRGGTAGHNTLTVDDQNESVLAHCPITALRADADGGFAVADLSPCYPGRLRQWRRGVDLRGTAGVLMQDEVEPAGKPVRIVWLFHTMATVATHGRSATLTQDGHTMTLQRAEPDGATFTAADASHPPTSPLPNQANPGLTDVQVVLPGVDRPTTIAVELLAGDRRAMRVRPPDRWR